MAEQKQPERELTDEEILENATIADGMADSTHDGGARPASSKPRIIPTDKIIVEYDEE